MKEITIEIKNGSIKTEANGYRGKECSIDLDKIETIMETHSIVKRRKEGVIVVRKRQPLGRKRGK